MVMHGDVWLSLAFPECFMEHRLDFGFDGWLFYLPE
jgi:hypothetical protein